MKKGHAKLNRKQYHQDKECEQEERERQNGVRQRLRRIINDENANVAESESDEDETGAQPEPPSNAVPDKPKTVVTYERSNEEDDEPTSSRILSSGRKRKHDKN
jgi:hypothetical protein